MSVPGLKFVQLSSLGFIYTEIFETTRYRSNDFKYSRAIRKVRGDVPHYESKFQSWLMSHSNILHTGHFLVCTRRFSLCTGLFLLHTRSFLLRDSYHMTITMVIICKQKGMDTLFYLFLHYFVMVTYLNLSDIIYNVLTLF